MMFTRHCTFCKRTSTGLIQNKSNSSRRVRLLPFDKVILGYSGITSFFKKRSYGVRGTIDFLIFKFDDKDLYAIHRHAIHSNQS